MDKVEMSLPSKYSLSKEAVRDVSGVRALPSKSAQPPWPYASPSR